MRGCIGTFFICLRPLIIINTPHDLLCTTLYMIFKLLNGNSIETDVGLEKIYKKIHPHYGIILYKEII